MSRRKRRRGCGTILAHGRRGAAGRPRRGSHAPISGFRGLSDRCDVVKACTVSPLSTTLVIAPLLTPSRRKRALPAQTLAPGPALDGTLFPRFMLVDDLLGSNFPSADPPHQPRRVRPGSRAQAPATKSVGRLRALPRRILCVSPVKGGTGCGVCRYARRGLMASGRADSVVSPQQRLVVGCWWRWGGRGGRLGLRTKGIGRWPARLADGSDGER